MYRMVPSAYHSGDIVRGAFDSVPGTLIMYYTFSGRPTELDNQDEIIIRWMEGGNFKEFAFAVGKVRSQRMQGVFVITELADSLLGIMGIPMTGVEDSTSRNIDFLEDAYNRLTRKEKEHDVSSQG